MTDSTFQQSIATAGLGDRPGFAPSPDRRESPEASRVRWLAFRMAFATWILMAIGSATRVTNAGLACPDWPLCYGQAVPVAQMNLQVFLEWFHRLDAGLLGLSAVSLVGYTLWHRRRLPRWVPWMAGLVLLAIGLQAGLGALTVTELLRFDIVTAHLGMALLLFAALLVAGTALLPYQGTGTTGKLSWVGLTAAIAIYLQSLLGGLVGSQWAVHQCLDDSRLCGVMNAHLLGVVPATLAAIAVPIWAWRIPALHPRLRQLRGLTAALLALQLLVGYATFRLHLQVEWLTVTHQAVGAALFGALVVLTVLARRDAGSTATRDRLADPVANDLAIEG